MLEAMQGTKHVLRLCVVLLSVVALGASLEWQQNLCDTLTSVGINEGVGVGGEVGFLQAQAPSPLTITYRTASNILAVNENSGAVTLGVPLDREASPSIEVSFTARDSEGAEISVACEVPVTDSNDNAPQFLERPYTTTVKENAISGFEVFGRVIVTDVDLGANAEIDISCYVPTGNDVAAQACDKFDIVTEMVSAGRYTGRITLTGSLDYETTSSYVMTIRAQDRGIPTRVSQTTVDIKVIDVQDSPPTFLTSQLSLTVKENAPLDTVLQPSIEVRDGDMGSPRPLLIRITSDPQNLFKLGTPTVLPEQFNLYTVNVLANGAINREVLGNSYTLEVQVVELNQDNQETSAQATMPITITILDENDNPPEFNQDNFSIETPEQLAPGTDMSGLNMIITDPDIGVNAFCEVSLQNDPRSTLPVPMSEVYEVSPVSGTGTLSIVLIVKDPQYMDYENPAYRTQYLQVVAKETSTTQGFSSTAIVTITLMDKNDNLPRFANNQYTMSLRENSQVGTIVTTITATDFDSGDYGRVTYSLSGSGSEFFTVHNGTGVIRLAQALDFETQNVYVLQFEATDGGERTQTVPLRINILDFNDEGPVFSRDQYDGILLEMGIVIQPPITVEATDADSDFPVTYAIVGGNTIDNAFRLNNGDLSVIRPIDINETPNRQGFFELIIEGSDNGIVPQTTRVVAVITIRDLNDRTPEFGQAIYVASVPEVGPLNNPVVTVSATDMDMGRNADITYIIDKGHKDNFVIDGQSGLISTAVTDLNIDRYSNRYSVIVHAVDGGSPQRTGTATAEITVLDSNNVIPSFGQAKYVFTILESADPRTVVETIMAEDTDTTASIVYRMRDGSVTAKDKSGNTVTSTAAFNYLTAFAIHPTQGEIYTTSTLNRNEVAEVTFVVEAEDTNGEFPQVQIGVATVQINILSSKDGGINFQPPWSNENPEFTITVPEETPIDSMMTQVTAIDPETGDPISIYREVAGSDPQNYFTVELTTGRVLLNRRLDYETLIAKTLSFQLQAFTPPPEPQSAVATIRVIVEDINDHSPVFVNPSGYSYSIPEDFQYPDFLGPPFLEAKDADSGNFSRITYTLTGQGSEMFVIDPNTGVVSVAPNVSLDRERVFQYNLVVTAEDNVGGFGEQRFTSILMTITLTDINDNMPRFQQSSYNVYTLETVGAQTSLSRVTALDEDSGRNGQVDYDIQPDSEIFYIETSTGIIRNNVPLDGYAKELPYRLTVSAQDRGTVPQAVNVPVNIYVNDQQSSDGTPRILFPPEDGMTFNLPEGSGPGTNVTQIEAQNRNPQSGSVIIYGFLSNDAINANSDKFHIDPETGVITVKGDLDYESKFLYELIIVIKTNSDPPLEVQRRIFVNITDIDDNKPSFQCPGIPYANPVAAAVLENKMDEYVTQVQACDADGIGNNIVYYFISCGNDPDNNFGGQRPFKIDSVSGEITTNVSLDREYRKSYQICVQAINDANPTIVIGDSTDAQPSDSRKKRQAGPEPSAKLQLVTITVLDEDDNGPRFGSGDGIQSFDSGVLATARYGTDIIQIQASDGDNDPDTAQIKYSLDDEEFFHPDRNDRTPLAFKVGEETGMVVTNLNSYLNYIDGYFIMKVVATDSQGRQVYANLHIYVVRESQRLRYVFNSEINEVKDFYQHFMREVRLYFPTGTQINSDAMRYHILQEGRVDFDKTDLCFHMVRDNSVVNADRALATFQEKRRTEPELRALYSRYTVVDAVGVCQIKTTTKWWSGYYWLWWLLITLALFILLVSLFMICCICCYWPKYRKNSYREKPYVILDPPMAMPDYEWQEEIVHMD